MESCMNCKIEYEDINRQRMGIIRFCPLHQAAPELLRAAKMTREVVGPGNSDQTTWNILVNIEHQITLGVFIQDAINMVEG